MSYLLDEHGVERVLIPSLGRELRPLRDLATAWRAVARDAARAARRRAHAQGQGGRDWARLRGARRRAGARAHLSRPRLPRLFRRVRRRASSSRSSGCWRADVRGCWRCRDGSSTSWRGRYGIAPRRALQRRAARARPGAVRRRQSATAASCARGSASAPMCGSSASSAAWCPVKDHATFIAAAALLARAATTCTSSSSAAASSKARCAASCADARARGARAPARLVEAARAHLRRPRRPGAVVGATRARRWR